MTSTASSSHPDEGLSRQNDKTLEPDSTKLSKLCTDDVQVSLYSEKMKMPESKLNCLEKLDQLCIKKGIKFGLSQTRVHTEIYSSQNQNIFKAKEQIEQNYMGCCYYPNRWLDMDIVDLFDEEVVHLSRDKRVSCFWYSCNSPTLEIFLSSRGKIGAMKAVSSNCFSAKYNIEDDTGDCVLKIRSALSFPYGYFNILSKDKSMVVGKISRERPESHHVFSRNYNVHVSFPIELDVRLKAVLLGAALTLISTDFEESE